MRITKLRSIPSVVKEIKLDDPDTAVTTSLIRKLIDLKMIETIVVGKKIMVDYNQVVDLLRLS